MSLPEIDDVISKARLMSNLEYQVKITGDRLKAAQRLRTCYKNSPFAVEMIAEKEKEFKKDWWEACENYYNFKKLFLGE